MANYINKDEAICEFYKAFSELQGEIPALKKNAVVSYGQTRFKYADLGEIMTTIKEPLKKHGFSVHHRFVVLDGVTLIKTVLMHQSGHSEESSLPIKLTDKPQDLGSLITYYRRYAISSLLGIAADDDDDGQAAAKNVPEVKNATKTPNPFISPQQYKLLSAYIAAHKIDSPKLLKSFDIPEGKKLPKDKFDDAMALARTMAEEMEEASV